MTALLWLIPIALILGSGALCMFVWALSSGQFDDTLGDATRMLGVDDHPILDPVQIDKLD